jgi:Asp-tRNA(Asn)/Glu-tRNA(Gln) amidotransferase A subunit family amidase
MKHISLVNFIGLPSYSVPVGFLPPNVKHNSEQQDIVLPVGIQLIGDHWGEDVV